jgi:hypothetical protein
MDITSPRLLKIKGALFLMLGVLAAGLLAWTIWPSFNWQVGLLFAVSIWAFCRAYYFCFYVMEHYAEPGFRYAGLLDLALHLSGLRRREPTKETGGAPDTNDTAGR